MRNVAPDLRARVVLRAGNRCEYCRLSQTGQEAVFHVDHIHPRADGGPTTEENLALACVSCSLRKSARLAARDPDSGQDVPLFHPRLDDWHAHFVWDGVVLVGRTPTGRATVHALGMNRGVMLAIREQEAFFGRHPESD